mgnify:FL=1
MKWNAWLGFGLFIAVVLLLNSILYYMVRKIMQIAQSLF